MKFTRIATVAVALLFMAVAVQSAYAQSISMEDSPSASALTSSITQDRKLSLYEREISDL